MSLDKENKIECFNKPRYNGIHSDVSEGISGTKKSSDEILDFSYYEQLINYAISISEGMFEDNDFDIDKFQREIYDFYGEYDYNTICEGLDFIKKRDSTLDENSLIIDSLRTFDIVLVPLKRLIKNYETELSIENKKLLLLEINKFIEELFNKYSFNYYDGHRENDMTIDMFYELSGRGFIDGKYSNIPYMEEIGYFLQKVRFEEKFEKKIGILDINELREETKKFGAKGANLAIIRNVLERICSLNYRLSSSFNIPNFKKVDVLIYDKWNNGEDIVEDLQQFYEWIGNRKIMVRSSAVYSEDGDDTTGAGIYESIEFDGNLSSINDFKKVVIEVYKSVNSNRAIEYRKNNGIQKEQMGLVLQELIEEEKVEEKTDGFSCIRDKGYINTIVKGVPRLMDIITKGGVRPIVDKTIIGKVCGNEFMEGGMFYYQLDADKVKDILTIQDISIFSYLLEKYYNKPIQIEYITSEVYSENFSRSTMQTSILQARFLPKNYSYIEEIHFPNKEVLFEGRALGVGDLNLDILSNLGNNTEKTGIVLFKASEFASLGHDFQEYALPKSGVVVVIGKSQENKGHIETLCAEKGLLLIFNDNYKSGPISALFSGNNDFVHIDEFHGEKKLHIVMDGLVGKIYKQ